MNFECYGCAISVDLVNKASVTSSLSQTLFCTFHFSHAAKNLCASTDQLSPLFSFFFLQRSFWRLYNPSLAASFRYKLLMTAFDEDSDRLPIYSIEYYAFNPTHLLLAHR
jgi:hypothetical protein